MDKLTQAKYKTCGFINTTPTGKLIYLFLDELTFWNNGEAILPQRVICDTLRLSRSAVRRNLRRLAAIGAINIIPMYYEDGGRKANKYVVR